jgi:hypothetical protein
VQYGRPPPDYKAPVGNYQQSYSGNLDGHQSRAGNGGQRNPFQVLPPSSRPMQQTNGGLGFGPGNGYKGACVIFDYLPKKSDAFMLFGNHCLLKNIWARNSGNMVSDFDIFKLKHILNSIF